MVGHRFLVCCVLVLTIYELGGATGSIDYTLDPVTKPKKDEQTDVSINFFLTVSTKLFNEESVSMVFTVKPLNQTLNILISDIIVPESNVSVETKDGFTMYSGEFEVQVSVTADTDGVIGNLRATLSCDHPILCKDEDKTVVKTKVIVKETKTLSVTATPSYSVSPTTADVTVTLSKDLATPDKLTLSVSLINEDPQGEDYSSEGVLASDAESSFPVVFPNIQWGDYQLTIGCGNNSVCSALSQWLHFPEPVSVPAHPSYSELSKTIFGLKAECNKVKNIDCTTVAATTAETSSSVVVTTEAPGPPAMPSTRYMKLAVGGLIAALVCGLLGYLLYHYRTKVKEWICSKKVVVSNLPIARKLRKNASSKYSKLPQTMQEALHQD